MEYFVLELYRKYINIITCNTGGTTPVLHPVLQVTQRHPSSQPAFSQVRAMNDKYNNLLLLFMCGVVHSLNYEIYKYI